MGLLPYGPLLRASPGRDWPIIRIDHHGVCHPQQNVVPHHVHTMRVLGQRRYTISFVNAFGIALASSIFQSKCRARVSGIHFYPVAITLTDFKIRQGNLGTILRGNRFLPWLKYSPGF